MKNAIRTKHSLEAYVKRLKKLPPLKRRERPFEYRLRDELNDKHQVMFVKIKPSRRGLPDRMAIGLGNMLLVEVKREGEDLEEHQKIMHRKLYHTSGKRVLTVWLGGSLDAARIRIVQALTHWR